MKVHTHGFIDLNVVNVSHVEQGRVQVDEKGSTETNLSMFHELNQ